MDQPAHAVQDGFGFERFRPGQAEAVEAALAGRDSLVVMPVGAGKSICYQLPALMRDGNLDVRELRGVVEDEAALRAVIGHLARAGFVKPLPAPADRVAGLVVGRWDGAVPSACLAAARDGERLRWRQYRAVWEYVESESCRRRALLRYFGDEERAQPAGECCDACAAAAAVPAA